MIPQAPGVTVVVPTTGRPSLPRLLGSLAVSAGPLPERILLVDDRADARRPLLEVVPDRLAGRVQVCRGAAAGPAAARNLGWREARTPWVAFLDDDVLVTPDWLGELADDLRDATADVGGVQGRIRVPLPRDRAATDWERNVAGLRDAVWATADLAYRRRVLALLGGFDERFIRAYREDADLGLRVTESGWRIVRGRRTVLHPVRPAGPLVSVRLQRGNADDALLHVLHGPDWRARARVPHGRRSRHLALTAAALLAVGAGLRRRRAAPAAVAVWLAGTAELAAARIRPGPRTPDEVVTMVVTSAVIPPAATWHWLRGWWHAVRVVRAPATAEPLGW